MGFFVLRNGQYRNTELTFSDYVMGYIKGGSDLNGPSHAAFNIHSHLFCEFILSKFSQEKL